MRARTWLTLLAVTLPLAWFMGCFTEVGNAEDEQLVSGEFKIDYSANPVQLPKTGGISGAGDSLAIVQFYLQVREAEFKAFDSATMHNIEHHLWRDDSASLPVDFTGKDSFAVLPVQKIMAFQPDNLVLQCRVPKQGILNPDTLNFEKFADKGYIKGIFTTGKVTEEFLFQLPETREIHLEYSKAALMSWLKGNTYRCEFVFFATKWIEGVNLDKAAKSRDKSGNPLIILGSGHNQELYRILVERFYMSFNTQRVFAEVGR